MQRQRRAVKSFAFSYEKLPQAYFLCPQITDPLGEQEVKPEQGLVQRGNEESPPESSASLNGDLEGTSQQQI